MLPNKHFERCTDYVLASLATSWLPDSVSMAPNQQMLPFFLQKKNLKLTQCDKIKAHAFLKHTMVV